MSDTGRVAGMTATVPLSTRRAGLTDVWFVGFAPAEHPTVAVAVAVALELDHGGFGGTTAGPIAARVIASLVRSAQGAGSGGWDRHPTGMGAQGGAGVGINRKSSLIS